MRIKVAMVAFLAGWVLIAARLNSQPRKPPQAGETLGCYSNDEALAEKLRNKDNHTDAKLNKNGFVIWRVNEVFDQRIDFMKVPCEGHLGQFDYQVTESYLVSRPKVVWGSKKTKPKGS